MTTEGSYAPWAESPINSDNHPSIAAHLLIAPSTVYFWPIAARLMIHSLPILNFNGY